MASALTYAVLELTERAGERGVPMGAVVDALEARGYAVQDIEAEVWSLLAKRRLTPSGFVCRTIKRSHRSERSETMRVYEFTLVPWSPELDHQLELSLPQDPTP